MGGYEPLVESPHALHSPTPTHGSGAAPARSGSVPTIKMESPVWYLMKAVFVYVLVVLDIFLNSSVNTNMKINHSDRLTTFWPFLFIVVQTSVQIFIFLTIFLLMCNTYLMQIGLPGLVMSNFKLLGWTQLIYLLTTVALGVLRIIGHSRAQEAMASVVDVWAVPGYELVFVLQNLSAGLYYHQVLFATFQLANEKYYSKLSARPDALV